MRKITASSAARRAIGIKRKETITLWQKAMVLNETFNYNLGFGLMRWREKIVIILFYGTPKDGFREAGNSVHDKW